MNPEYLSGALEGATIPPELIIQLPHAWLIVFAALTLCCGALWFLTRGVNSASPKDGTNDAMRPGRVPPRRYPHLQPLPHHGSRAA